MLVAIPSRRVFRIIKEHGFISFPQYLDCFIVQDSENYVDLFMRELEKLKREVRITVLPDYKYELWESLLKEHSDKIWIAPVHFLKEVNIVVRLSRKLDLEILLGYPCNSDKKELSRNYGFGDLEKISRKTGIRIWLLGLKEGEKNLLLSDSVVGFDTVIPVLYATRYGKIWLSWGISVSSKSRLKSKDILEINLKNFRNALLRMGIIVR